MSPFDSVKAARRVKSVKYIKVSILKATYRESACSIAGAHVGIAAIEVEAASIRAANCTAPIAAEGTDIEERTIAAAEARHGQFKRRGKSANACVSSPT